MDELLGLMRALGKNPTEEELLGLVMEVDIDGNGTIEFGEFIDLMKHNSLDVDEEADLRTVLRTGPGHSLSIVFPRSYDLQ